MAPEGKHCLHAYLPATEPYHLWKGLKKGRYGSDMHMSFTFHTDITYCLRPRVYPERSHHSKELQGWCGV